LELRKQDFFPGVLYYLSLWFPPHERGFALALFFTITPLTGIFGGVFSFGILQVDVFAGLKGWQWLLLIEGIPSVILGFLTFFYLPERPETCKFLTPEEKTWVVSHVGTTSTTDRKSMRKFVSDLKLTLRSWKLWFFCLFGIGPQVIGGVTNFFLPAIIKGFGVSGLMSNLLTAPPSLLGLICLVVNSYFSDVARERPIHTIIPFFLSIVAWAIVSVCYFLGLGLYAQYFSLLIAIGLLGSFNPVYWAWFTEEIKNENKVAFATAFAAAFGISTNIWVPLMTTSIYLSTGSYVYVIISMCCFGCFGLFFAILLAIIPAFSRKRNQYITLVDDKEDIRMKN